MFENAQIIGPGLWYLPQVFDARVFYNLRRCYRHAPTQWEMSYPNRLNTRYGDPHLSYLAEVAHDIAPAIANIAGFSVSPLNQEVFIDLSGHSLSWHFDNQLNYKILLQVYSADVELPGLGTHWHIGDDNVELFERFGENSIVDITGLELTETPYRPNAGYINDNTQRKTHGTRRVTAGYARESILFTFG